MCDEDIRRLSSLPHDSTEDLEMIVEQNMIDFMSVIFKDEGNGNYKCKKCGETVIESSRGVHVELYHVQELKEYKK